MEKLTEKTMISFSLILPLISLIVFVSNLSGKAEKANADIHRLETQQEKLTQDLIETQKQILVDITEIKTILKNGK